MLRRISAPNLSVWLPQILVRLGSEGVDVVARDDRAAGAIGAEDAVVAGDLAACGTHTKHNLVVHRSGPAELGQVVTGRQRSPVVAEPHEGQPKVADQCGRERVGVRDHGLIGVEGLGAAVDAGLVSCRDRSADSDSSSKCSGTKKRCLSEKVWSTRRIVLIVVAADARIRREVIHVGERRCRDRWRGPRGSSAPSPRDRYGWPESCCRETVGA